MRTLLPRLRAELRQRRHHRAFRIAPAKDTPLLAELERLLADVETLTEPEPDLDERTLVEAATNLWRAQRKLAQDTEGRYTRPAGRYLGLCRDSLSEIGLVVQDHDGDAYHSGRSLEVLAFEDDPGTDAERVLRTVRPSIYFRDRHIQTGQVIVGCPVVEQQGDNCA
jgi:hypothetical protein